MKRILAALFMYLRIGVGASMVLMGFAKAVYLSTNPRSGDEVLIVFCMALGLPLLLARAVALDEVGSFQLSHEPEIGMLGDDSYELKSLQLEAGTLYALVAVCDEDCLDIDLVLFDENANVISSDLDADDMPIVLATPAWTGRFVLGISMRQCLRAPCYYGVGVFRAE